jgi:hypothetical protein
MKKIVMGATLLTLVGSVAAAQTNPPQPIPPGFGKGPETKWGGSDLPPGLSNDNSKRDWQTPPGWSSQNSQGWQNGPGTTGGGKGRGK